MKIVFVTPIFQNMVGGAAIYYNQLVSYLSKHVDIIVISEKTSTPARRLPSVKIIGLFPEWAGRNRSYKDYFKYLWQNINYLKLVKLLQQERPNFVVVHSFFYKHRGLFPWIMLRLISSFPTTKFVLDVRDRSISANMSRYLHYFTFFISCSSNVTSHLKDMGIEDGKIKQIPVIHDPLKKRLERLKPSTLIKPFLKEKYILYAGAIKESKKVDLLLESFVSITKHNKNEMKILLAGPLKTKSKKMKLLLEKQGVHWLGQLEREEIIILVANANLVVNLSPIESLSRICLEAIDLDRPVILPPNVPEFKCCCSEFINKTSDPKQVGKFILKVLDEQKVPNYPIEAHYSHEVMKKYYQVFGLEVEESED
jgi:glycosyltransferase involved in cell wall biosynthesis